MIRNYKLRMVLGCLVYMIKKHRFKRWIKKPNMERILQMREILKGKVKS